MIALTLSLNFRVVPDSPRSNTLHPHFVHNHLVTKTVHWVPESVMWESEQVAFASQVLHRLLFPRDQVAIDVVHHL